MYFTYIIPIYIYFTQLNEKVHEMLPNAYYCYYFVFILSRSFAAANATLPTISPEDMVVAASCYGDVFLSNWSI